MKYLSAGPRVYIHLFGNFLRTSAEGETIDVFAPSASVRPIEQLLLRTMGSRLCARKFMGGW